MYICLNSRTGSAAGDSGRSQVGNLAVAGRSRQSDSPIRGQHANCTFVYTLSSSQEILNGHREYGDYVQSALDPSILASDGQVLPGNSGATFRTRSGQGQLAQCVKEWDVDARDVGAVHDLAQSAGIARVIPRGTYKGLPQGTPARDVVAIIYEELDAIAGIDRDRISPQGSMETMRVLATLIAPRLHERTLGVTSQSRSDVTRYGLKCIPARDISMQESSASPEKLNSELHFDVPAVVEQIALTLSKLSAVNEVYSNYLHLESLSSVRAPSASPQCLALYSKFLSSGSERRQLTEQSGRICTADLDSGGSWQPAEIETFEGQKEQLASVLAMTRHREAVFEQVSADLYARRANRYMLFNHVGADCFLVMLRKSSSSSSRCPGDTGHALIRDPGHT